VDLVEEGLVGEEEVGGISDEGDVGEVGRQGNLGCLRVNDEVDLKA
jgi:hypothetical protein